MGAGGKKQLTDQDLWDLADTDAADPMYQRFKVHWEAQQLKEKYVPCCLRWFYLLLLRWVRDPHRPGRER